ncbi:MAG: tetratricopeptide repeat protein [Bacteroidales bacterium]|nr:tetratricopeptide repeat protein [Bacteroidales bacterium]MBN2818385.1 tetratricopeptide repeat protein [Bacteroidales bacterium]
MKKSYIILIILIVIILAGIISIKPIKKSLSQKNNEAGMVFYNQEEYDKAAPLFEKATKQNKGFVEAYINLAKTLLILNNNQKAFETAKAAIQLDNKSPELFSICGQSKINEGDYNAGIDFFNQAIEIDSSFSIAYYYRGIAKANLGDLTAALDDYKKAQELDATNAEYYESSVVVRTKLEDYSGLIKDYSKIIELDPSNTEAFYQRGYFKLNINDFEGAVADFDNAIKLDNKLGKAYYYKGLANAKNGKYDDGISSFEQSAKLGYKPDISYFNIGLAYMNQNKTKLAKEAFIKCISANKEGEKAMEARNNLGAIELMNSNFEAAIKVFSGILEINDKNTDALFNRAYSYYSLKKYKEAIPDLDKCIVLGRTNPEVFFLRGVQYIAQNEFKTGCADLQTAADAGHADAKNMMGTYCGGYKQK